MNLELRVALISSDSKVNQELRGILSRELSSRKDEELRLKVYSTLPSVEDAVVHYTPHLIVVHIEPEQRKDKLAFLDHISRVAARIPVIVSAPDLDADLMLACVKKGVRDFIKQPLQEADIREMITRLLRESPAAAEENKLGITYSYFSYKGGIGTTFLACNTAVALARKTKSRVLLWDLVLQNGDVPFFFDYEPPASLTDLMENLSQIDEPYLRGTLPLHPTGITILAGTKRPEEAESIRADQVQALHLVLRK